MADLVEKALAMPNVIEDSWTTFHFHDVSEMIEGDWAALCLVGHLGNTLLAYQTFYSRGDYPEANYLIAETIGVPLADLLELVDAHEQIEDAGKIIKAIREDTLDQLLTNHQ